jgi:hypothetical protein
MSLATPGKIRELQIKLYRKAKNEPGYRFYMLYDKICREDLLSHAYELARANKDAPGVDGESTTSTGQLVGAAGCAYSGNSNKYVTGNTTNLVLESRILLYDTSGSPYFGYDIGVAPAVAAAQSSWREVAGDVEYHVRRVARVYADRPVGGRHDRQVRGHRPIRSVQRRYHRHGLPLGPQRHVSQWSGWNYRHAQYIRLSR